MEAVCVSVVIIDNTLTVGSNLKNIKKCIKLIEITLYMIYNKGT